MHRTPEEIATVQARIESGSYRVDSGRVASAMLERLGAIALRREVHGYGSGLVEPPFGRISASGDRDPRSPSPIVLREA